MEAVEQALIPHVVSAQTLVTLPPGATVAQAVEAMLAQRIAAVLICEPETVLKGIFSERDAVARVLGAGRDPATTRLDAVMTPDPDTVAPEATPRDALRLMDSRGYRHLPVVEAGTVRGIVSVRDLFAVVNRQLEQEVEARDAFMYGWPSA